MVYDGDKLNIQLSKLSTCFYMKKINEAIRTGGNNFRFIFTMTSYSNNA